MSYSIIQKSGTIVVPSFYVPAVPASTYPTDAGGSFDPNTYYGVAVDYYDPNGRSYPLKTGSPTEIASGSSLVVQVNGNGSPWAEGAGVGIYLSASSSDTTSPYYHYADVSADGVITYKNGANSGISVSGIDYNLTITITKPGPTQGDVPISDIDTITFYGSVSETITVPADENWLIKDFLMPSAISGGISITLNGFPIWQAQMTNNLYSWGYFQLMGGTAQSSYGNNTNDSAYFPSIFPAGSVFEISILNASRSVSTGWQAGGFSQSYNLTAVTI